MSAKKSEMKVNGKGHFVLITSDPLSHDSCCELVASEEAGAISTFIGTTRNNFDGKKVTLLEYEAYVPMAEKGLLKVCEQAAEKWEVIKIAIFHRLGVVPVKESSVIIAVSSAHRTESLKAVEYCINTLKADVPIWKKEVYDVEDGERDTSCWKANKEFEVAERFVLADMVAKHDDKKSTL